MVKINRNDIHKFLFWKNQCNDGAEFQDAVKVTNFQNVDSIEQTLEEENEEKYVETKVETKVDCTQCLMIRYAFCLAEPRNDPNLVRMEFDDMVEKMTKKKNVCTCSDGFIPGMNWVYAKQ